MSTPTEQVFGIYELTERILVHLNDPVSTILAQRVCRTWNSIIRTSPALRQASWYKPHPAPGPWKLNPAFTRFGVCTQDKPNKPKHHDWSSYQVGGFSLQKRIRDKPGSWTDMLATQPPVTELSIACFGDYSGDETMWYFIKSMSGPLLMGDIIAILAECQNRQERGVDRWAGVVHFTGQLEEWTPQAHHDWEPLGDGWNPTLALMPDDVSIKVAVAQAWGSGEYTAFSLKRIHGARQGFLHELIVHEMVDIQGDTYSWGSAWGRHSAVKEGGPYKANLLAVREHGGEYQNGYLQDYVGDGREMFRLVSDVGMDEEE